ncbi:MAG TPA: hypothetical protein VIA61_19175 [Methylomirabilota bacterium]|jgi:hypothetical protein
MARTSRRAAKPKARKRRSAPQESRDPTKISVRLDPRLIQWAKLHAVQTSSTVHEVIEVALVNHLKSHAPIQEELDARLMKFATRHEGRRGR